MEHQISPAVAAEVEKFVEKLIAAKTDRASARCDLGLTLEQKGLWDLSWDADWLDTVLDLNVSLYFGWRYYIDGLRLPILDEWPALELFGAFPRSRPRDWTRRWIDAGGQLYSGKMIALKDSPIWYALSDFGFPFPPFAIGSGMEVRAVTRSSAMTLGLIGHDRQVVPKTVTRPKLILLDPAL